MALIFLVSEAEPTDQSLKSLLMCRRTTCEISVSAAGTLSVLNVKTAGLSCLQLLDLVVSL